MRDDIRTELLAVLKQDFRWKRETGTWLQGGKCPQCEKLEAFARADAPWVIKCGRAEKCGWEQTARERYPDIFEDCTKRAPATPENPTASADYYLSQIRHLDLRGLRGHYSQETFYDRTRDIATATVRFPLPAGSYWERLIDTPSRFDRKAHFATGKAWGGRWWQRPDVSMADLAAAPVIWIAEGIFDALALEQAGVRAVSTMSCNKYPEESLRQLRQAIADGANPGHQPKLIWAYDNGPAGERYIRQFARDARKEGWVCGAALVRDSDEDGAKLDWNDLLIRDKLDAKDRDLYQWNGELLLAATPVEKATLIRERHKLGSFHFTFLSRTYWATYDAAGAEEQATESIRDRRGKLQDISDDEIAKIRADAAAAALTIEEIANCAFRALYRQRDEASDDTCYFLHIDFPSDRQSVKGGFPASAMMAAGDFKKRLFAIGTGAIWTGSQGQLDRIMQRQTPRIADVHPLEFTGYSRDHGAYVFGELAVKDGRVFRPNDDDYFEMGKIAIKLGTSERLLDIKFDPDKQLDVSWYRDLWTAYGPKGLIVLAFFFGTLFAEQIRRDQKSFFFLEMHGQPGTGKTTLVEFLWKLFGRENYEGFDPAKATPAAMARNLGKVGNLPVVLIEGDRRDEASHARKFEWEELKTAFNGRSVRSRGVKNKGMETFEPPFRGGVVIEQNDQVNASRAILERIVSLGFDMTGWTDDTKSAAQRLEQWPVEKVSAFIIHAVRREAELLARFGQAFQEHEKALMALPAIRTNRLAKNHGQLLALLDALRLVVPIRAEHMQATHALILQIAAERQTAVNAEHPAVTRFWEVFDYLLENEDGNVAAPLDHSRDPDLISIRLNEFEQRCAERRLDIPSAVDLRRALKTSKLRRYLETKPINSKTGAGTKHCWVFARPGANR